MIFYLILLIIVILINLVPSQSRRLTNIKLVFSFLLIFVFLAIRVDFGGDHNSYLSTFDFIKDNFVPKNYKALNTEIGFVLLNYILPSYRSLLIITSAFTSYTYYWVIKKYVPPKYYGSFFILMLLFSSQVLFFQLSGLRNAIALNIMILSTPLIIKRRFLPYILLSILAFLFHRSAILYMPIVYFVATPKDFKKSDFIKWSIVAVIFITISTTIFVDILNPIIDKYFNKYSSYLEHAADYQFSDSSSILLIGFVGIFLTFSFLLIKNTKLNPSENVIFKLSLLYILSIALNTLSPRGAQYFITFFLINAVLLINKARKPTISIAYVVGLLIYAFYLINSFMGKRYLLYETYQTIFD